jgi:RsiW-degrading membrane proteinase PrsW (M82 family)
MNCLLYLFGFLPSLIWLSFYLRKDVHPESDWEVIKVFFFGMLVAIPILLIELGMESISPNIIFYIFIGGAFVEEFLKYLVVKLEVLRNPELDEPCDLIFYMIIAALGFAAVENILSLRVGNAEGLLNLSGALGITSARFITATFLHTISSGILGYFIALSFYNYKKRKIYFLSGLIIAVVLHGLYNLSIMEISGWPQFILSLIILITAGTFLLLAIKKIKKIKSICNH